MTKAYCSRSNARDKQIYILEIDRIYWIFQDSKDSLISADERDEN